MLKTLLAQVKQYKRDSFLTPVFMILEVIMETVIPFMMGIIVNSVEGGDIRNVYLMGGLMVIAAGFSLTFGIMGGKFGASASTGFARNLRKAMYENIQTFSFANIDKFSTAGLITRLTTDVTNVQNAYQMLLRMAIRAPFSMIIAMVATLLISPKIAGIYLIAILFLGAVLSVVIKKATGYFTAAFPKYDELNASVQENVSAIRVVKAYVREEHEKKRFAKASDNIYKLFVQAENTIVLNMPIMMLTVYSCIMLISWVGAKMIVNTNQVALTTGELATCLTYCMTILSSLMMLSMVFVMLTMSQASGKRIAEVINEKATLTNPENPDYQVQDGSIDFKNVYFSYKSDGDDFVLEDINLHIKAGETVGIIGGTGSSKSSMVNLISRLYDVTKGELLVGGKNVKAYDLETLRNEVAVVLQKNVLFSGSILENLRWGDQNATEEECKRACELACADDFIQAMPDGYNTHIEQGGSNVSGGQKQRLCIARALLKKPKILILDDSTSAVDTATDARIRKAFAEEIPNTTKIIIAQRVSSVAHADHIVVMEDGKINGYGTHEQLLAENAIYREVYESQTSGSGDFDEKGSEL